MNAPSPLAGEGYTLGYDKLIWVRGWRNERAFAIKSPITWQTSAATFSQKGMELFHPTFGSSVVDHSATSARSRNVTVICPVAPSILT